MLVVCFMSYQSATNETSFVDAFVGRSNFWPVSNDSWKCSSNAHSKMGCVEASSHCKLTVLPGFLSPLLPRYYEAI